MISGGNVKVRPTAAILFFANHTGIFRSLDYLVRWFL